MKNLWIIGAGNFSKVVFDYAQRNPENGVAWTIQGLLVSDADGTVENELVKGHINQYIPLENDVFICSYVNGNERQAAVEIIEKKGGKFINLVHPLANVALTAVIGTGNIIGAFATLSVDTVTGNHNIIQDHCNVGHDTSIGDFSHLYVGCIISGKNQIGTGVSLFTGSVVYPKIKIGDQAVVGAGSVVMKHVKPGTTVFGYPAKLVE